MTHPDAPSKTEDMSPEEALAIVDAMAVNKINFYQPYPLQRDFHNLGATKKERCLIAANKVGKCNSYCSNIELADGSVKTMGELFEAGEAFRVMAWDGHGAVEAQAHPPYKKPGLHQCYRVFTSDGSWFECADDHLVLADGARYDFVASLLESVPRASLSHSTLREDGPRWSGTLRDSQGDCLHDSHCDGERPQPWTAAARGPLRSQVGARARSLPGWRSDALGSGCRRSRLEALALPSSQSAALRAVDPLAESLGLVCDIASRWWSGVRRSALRLALASTSRLRSAYAAHPRRSSSSQARALLHGGNSIIAYADAGLQEVYDFRVEGYENYITSGATHHNSFCGAAEMSIHARGVYPSWWKGHRFTRPILCWAAGVTNETTRDNVQKMLLGEAPYGSGAIPKEDILKVVMGRGIPGLIDHVMIRHASGGVTKIQFKSFEQGQRRWWGPNVDLIWLDEEPPEEIYSEAIWRVAQVKGLVYMTFTPLLGRTPVVQRFFPEPATENHGTVKMKMGDAKHFADDPEWMQQMIDSTPEHEREARTQGIPMLGQGRIFTMQLEDLIVQPFDIPGHYARINGIDFGWDHPTAVSFLAHDRDRDAVYVIDEHAASRTEPAVHAEVIRARGEWVPIAWPNDGYQDSKQAGMPIADLYRRQYRLKMLHDKATHAPGTPNVKRNDDVEAGVFMMQEMMKTGRFKIFAHCEKFQEEFRNYHRKDGKIIKEMDDVISATRYGVVMRRFARTRSPSTALPSTVGQDYDPLERGRYVN